MSGEFEQLAFTVDAGPAPEARAAADGPTADGPAADTSTAADPAITGEPLSLVERWRAAGELAATDHHLAGLLVRRAGVTDPGVALAAALAVRANRRGDVGVDLDHALAAGPAPSPAADAVVAALAGHPDVVAVVDPDSLPGSDAALADVRPLVLVGHRLVTQRQFADERLVAEELGRRSRRRASLATPAALAALDAVLPSGADDSQRHAVLTALDRPLAVIAGGPGTGKTFTVAALLAALQAGEDDIGRPLSVAVAAPTGKAASRAGEAIAASPVIDPARRAELVPTTIHRLLGRRPGSSTRFAHHRGRRLPHDVVVVDETSMVSAALMARLLEALRDDARLVLVGDPGQLESVESGSVLADLVDASQQPASPLHDVVATLARSHRVEADTAIPALAAAVHAGDADLALTLLSSGHPSVGWLEVDDPVPVADDVVGPALTELVAAARAAERGLTSGGAEALDRAGAARILCGHRVGPYGVAWWNREVERRLVGPAAGDWYPGRVVLVGRNDPRTGLANGDTGVALAGEVEPAPGDRAGGGTPAEGVRVGFRRADELVAFSPAQLPDVETAFALTVHKSQGSEYRTVVVVLPPPGSPLSTRELLYTAVTRAKGRVVLVGSEAAVRHAVATPSGRVSGLAASLAADVQEKRSVSA